MTATPQHKDNADTYRYFGKPIYTYSLRQGIEDGFLAPYRVHRIITTWDAAGWRRAKATSTATGARSPTTSTTPTTSSVWSPSRREPRPSPRT